jgi:hypothetical protein
MTRRVIIHFMAQGSRVSVAATLLFAAGCARVGFGTQDLDLGDTCATGGCTAIAGFTQDCLAGEVPHLRSIDVDTTSELQTAVAAAQPGDLIVMADGVYDPVTLAVSGTAANPILLCGTRDAIIDGAGAGSLNVNANYWTVAGFTIRNTFWGVYVDGGSNNVIRELEVSGTGQYSILIRNNSADNTVRDTWMHDSGLVDPQWSQGVTIDYIDATGVAGCDRTQVLHNHFGPNLRAGSINVQDGQVGGLIADNYFDGTGQDLLAGNSECWVVIAGVGFTVTGNTGVNAVQDGFIARQGYTGAPSGNDNVFVDNVADVGSTGWGFNVDANTTGNVVDCNNVVRNAAAGSSSIACQ